MMAIFFSKFLKFHVDLKMAKKFNKILLRFYIIAFELVPANSKYYKENTCHRQTMFKQRAIKYQILPTREVF